MAAGQDFERRVATSDTLIGHGRSSEVYRSGPDRVLKLYRTPADPAAIENEFTAASLALQLGLPSPRPLGLVEEDGRPGIAFEHLDGPTMLRRYARRPIAFLAALRQLAHLQHAMHGCAAPGLLAQEPGLRAQIGYARVSEPVRQAALAALARLPEGDRLCHGDLHPGNVVSMPDGLRIIDWQKATAGHPAADVARTELMIRHGRFHAGWLGRLQIPAASQALAAAWYVRCYCAVGGMKLSEVAAWRLPMTVVRLSGQSAGNEAEVRATAERLVFGSRRRPAAATFAGLIAVNEFMDEALMACLGGLPT